MKEYTLHCFDGESNGGRNPIWQIYSIVDKCTSKDIEKLGKVTDYICLKTNYNYDPNTDRNPYSDPDSDPDSDLDSDPDPDPNDYVYVVMMIMNMILLLLCF